MSMAKMSNQPRSTSARTALVVAPGGGGEREPQDGIQVAVGGVLQAPGEAAGGFVTTVEGGAFLARILPERHLMPLGQEWVGGDVVPDGFLAQDGGLGEVLRLEALGDFFFPEGRHLQIALGLFGAPDGLDGVIVGLGNSPVAALKAG